MKEHRSPPLLCRDTASRPVARCKSVGAPGSNPACLPLPSAPNRDYVITLRLNRQRDADLIIALHRATLNAKRWDDRVSLNKVIITTLRTALANRT